MAPGRRIVVGNGRGRPRLLERDLAGRVGVAPRRDGRLVLVDRDGEAPELLGLEPVARVVDVDRRAGDDDRRPDPVGPLDQGLGLPVVVGDDVDQDVHAAPERPVERVRVAPGRPAPPRRRPRPPGGAPARARPSRPRAARAPRPGRSARATDHQRRRHAPRLRERARQVLVRRVAVRPADGGVVQLPVVRGQAGSERRVGVARRATRGRRARSGTAASRWSAPGWR